MTDGVKGLTIVLNKDYRTDDVQAIIHAIEMIKGVASVAEHIVTTEDYFNRVKIKQEILDKLYEMTVKA